MTKVEKENAIVFKAAIENISIAKDGSSVLKLAISLTFLEEAASLKGFLEKTLNVVVKPEKEIIHGKQKE